VEENNEFWENMTTIYPADAMINRVPDGELNPAPGG
jgi:hypothetical protein